MIARQVTLLTSQSEKLERLWNREYRPALARQEGFIAALLLKQKDIADTYQMLLIFSSEETAAQWRASDDHKQLGPLLAEIGKVASVSVFSIEGK